MDSRLLWVAQSGSVTDLYSLIQEEEDPCILQNVDVLPFMHTPLHEASSNGKIDLAMELMILKPSFAKKLNADGFTPLHLAIKNRQVELALELVKFDPSLIRIHGRGGMTPLHLVAKNGDVDLLTEFLLTCPECIRDANVNGEYPDLVVQWYTPGFETALHIAVIYDRYEELKVLRGWMQRIRESGASSTEIQVLNKRDRKGNTALHLAAYKNNHQAVKQLLKCMSLNRNIQNKSGMTALDALRVNVPHMNRETESIIKKSGCRSGMSLSRVKTTSVFLSKSVTFREYCSTGMARYRSRMSDGTRNSLLVITALIITATYQTAAQPEEKINFENQSYAEIILRIVVLWAFNTMAFLLAIALTFVLLPVGRAYTWWYIFIMGPLLCSYTILVYKTSTITIFIFMYLVFVFVFLIYLLPFYVKWKRTTRKKVPKPGIELISQSLGTMF